ncbi:conserved hypothetical protein [Vibrio owensii]|uniref:hypothetical protein n=1 Tax=Vibrio owensii TaxID=696485 RepID=UPI0028959214|nr:conserved hypothetical protein [Vibrio owensii]CAH1564909.1 conserved hypothetical protein [Vibrio owensii]
MMKPTMELYALPHQGQIKRVTRTLKKRTTLAYQYVAVRGDWVCLYASSAPQVARSEWWLDVLEGRGLLDARDAVLIELLAEDEWQGVLIEEGVVRQIWSAASYSQLSANIDDTRTLVVDTGEEALLEGTSLEENWTRIAPPSDEELARLSQYLLTSHAPRWKKPVLAGAVVMSVVGALIAGQAWQARQPKPTSTPKASAPAKPITLPPWMHYRLAIHDALSAHQVMQGALISAATLATLPPGWKTESITLQGHALTASILREPQGLVIVWSQWLTQHPALASQFTGNSDTQTLSIAINAGLPRWHQRAMPLRPTDARLQDTLVQLGAVTTLSHESTPSTWQSKTWQVTHPGMNVAELSQLASLFDALPLSMEALTLTPVNLDTWSLSFTITLYGGL